jgi:hypothetical protein
MSFVAQLADAERANRSLLCVGLDPDPARFPGAMRGDAARIFEFCAALVDQTKDLVIAFRAADRLLRRARRRSAARAADRLHPRRSAGGARDPDAKRATWDDRRAVRARSVRPLPRRRV